jgi:pantetheine-phosphate adenylyltransferase
MIAVYPGSFDPITNGHLDIVERAASVFEEVIVTVATNSDKRPMFTLEERKDMLSEACAHLDNVKVDSFDGLLVAYAQRKNAGVIVKGLRAVSDFQYEFEMAMMNRKVAPNVETVFLMTGAENSYLSSSIVKEIATLGGSVMGMVPESVEKRMRRRLKEGIRRDKP